LPDNLGVGAASVVASLWGQDDFSFLGALQVEKLVGHGKGFKLVAG